MPTTRLGTLNIVLLVVTAASLLFGIWGLMQVGQVAPAGVPIVADGDSASPTGESNRPAEPSDRPRPPGRDPGPVRPDTPPLDVAPGGPREVSNPTDRGTGRITGAVLFSDGRPVARVRVSLLRSDLQLQHPEWNPTDPEAHRADQDRYFRQLTRQTRLATTNDQGRFEFGGLDESLLYNATAGTTENGHGHAHEVAAGDDIKIWLEPTVPLTGTVKREDGTAVDTFTVNVSVREGDWWNHTASLTLSAAGGAFRIRAQVGSVRVVVTSPGLTMTAPTDPIQVGEDGAKVDVVMGIAAMLTGTILDSQGRPLRNAAVSATPKGEVKEEAFLDGPIGEGSFSNRWSRIELMEFSQNYTNTDSRGVYRINDLAPGLYTVTATFAESTESREATLVAGANRQDFTLNEGCRVTVLVTDARGKPVHNAWVYFYNPTGNHQTAVNLPRQTPGEYSFAGLPAGKCEITVQAAGLPMVRRKLELAAGDNKAEVSLVDGASVKGRASTTTGTPIAQHNVKLVKPGETGESWDQGYYWHTDATGAFQFGPVEPGEYELELRDLNNKKIHSQTVSLAAGANEVALNVFSAISVRVTVRRPDGSPAADCSVSLNFVSGNYHGYLNTNRQGICDFLFVPEGEGVVTVQGSDRTPATANVQARPGTNEVTVNLKEPNCVSVQWIESEGAGHAAGLQQGDLIIDYNATPTPNWDKLEAAMSATEPTATVSITIIREGQTQVLSARGGNLKIGGTNHAR